MLSQLTETLRELLLSKKRLRSLLKREDSVLNKAVKRKKTSCRHLDPLLLHGSYNILHELELLYEVAIHEVNDLPLGSVDCAWLSRAVGVLQVRFDDLPIDDEGTRSALLVQPLCPRPEPALVVPHGLLFQPLRAFLVKGRDG